MSRQANLLAPSLAPPFALSLAFFIAFFVALLVVAGVSFPASAQNRVITSHTADSARQSSVSSSLSFRDIDTLNDKLTVTRQNQTLTTNKLLDELQYLYGQSFTFKANSDKPLKAHKNGLTHQKFTQYYLGYPIWGHQLAVHSDASGQVVKLNGQVVKSIAGSLYVEGLQQAKFDKTTAIEKTIDILMPNSPANRFTSGQQLDIEIYDKQATAFVYIDEQGDGRLVYHVSFFYQWQNRVFAPNALVDANSLAVLKQWDGILYHQATGVGGNEKTGRYVYGQDKPHLQVSKNGQVCSLENALVTTRHMYGTWQSGHAHDFVCPNNDLQAENGAYSPLNDAHFHGTKSIEMIKQWLDTDKFNEPVNIEVHRNTTYGFVYENNIIIGTGGREYFPNSTMNSVGHEIGHLFNKKGLFWANTGQAGAVVESFADITGEALEYYLNGEVDWLVDAHVSKSDEPLRYFKHPSLDGHSIEHAGAFRDELVTHGITKVQTSGRCNFNLISQLHGININNNNFVAQAIIKQHGIGNRAT